jgi:hypothetical protein
MAAPYSYNPFFGPPPDPNDPRAMMNQVVQDSMMRPRAASAITPQRSMFNGQGPLMSLEGHAALAAAPKLAGGTRVTVEAYPIEESANLADHMFIQYDDGRDQYIYRGGDRPPWLHAQVTPADQSPDYGRGKRTLYETFLPGVPAQQSIRPAQADAQRINDAGIPYGFVQENSNSLVGDFTERQYGRRVGDGHTWGYAPLPVFGPTNPIW